MTNESSHRNQGRYRRTMAITLWKTVDSRYGIRDLIRHCTEHGRLNRC
jgi:hypothetical protein